jgi:5,10-methylenetetrahydromethanopterin reductase
MEIGVETFPPLGRAAQTAQGLELMGFASLLLPDSQNLAPEVWGQLMIAAKATSKIRLGTGVTNPLTRDPAVTASAALSLQMESGGRAICGIGRGDSSAQRIGKEAAPLAEFERYVRSLQTYLGGGTVMRDGFESRLEWLKAANVPKVPVEIAATGPRVIGLAARVADRIAFAVGAHPDHLAWALSTARAAAKQAGREPDSLRYGAYVNCVIHPNSATARDAIRGTVATFARFSAFPGSPLSRLPAPLQKAAEFLRVHYDMKEHTRASAEHARALEDEFIDWFGIAGPIEVALERFEKIRALGLDFCHVVPGSVNAARDVVVASLQELSQRIVPAMA